MNAAQGAVLGLGLGLVVGYLVCFLRYFRARGGVRIANAETARMMGESAAAIDAAMEHDCLLASTLHKMYAAQKSGDAEIAGRLVLYAAIIQYGQALDRVDVDSLPLSMLTAWDGWARDERLRNQMRADLGDDCF